MELITSMLEKSRDSPKPVEWFTTVGLFIQCKEDEVESFADLLQGVLNALQDAEILAFPLTNPADVKAFYANDFSSVRVPVEGRLPLLLDNDSMYSNIANHVLPNLIEFYDRYFVIEEVEYGTCMVCGLPQGGVSGYPRDLNFSFIEKLYALSASEKQVIKLDLVYLPMEKVAALENVENYTDAIDVNITTATRKNQEAQADKFKHERLKWKNKMDSLADGDIGEFYGVFIVTILTSDKKALDAAIRRVEGLLNGNRISHAIIAGRMREVYSWTKMVPLRHKKFLKKITPKLFSDSLTQITPLISGLHPRCSAEGTLYGVTIKGKEIIIDESKLAAKHMLICGSTGSGKTTAELTIGLRKYVQGNDVCYITVKSDEGTDFLNVARNLEVDGQVIELGPKTNPGETVYNVNILDILRPDTDFNPEIVFYAHISTLKNFFGVLFENSYGQSDNMPAYLEDSLVRLYKNFKIIPTNPDTWNPEIKPTLLDLVSIWENDASDNVSAEALLNKKSLFLHTGKFLSTQTNVDINKRFVVIDLSGISKVDRALGNAMNYFMVIMLSNRMFTRSERKKVLMVDEARVFFKNPLLSEQLVRYITQLRSFGGELIISTLEVNDFAEVSQEILANVYKVLVLGANSRKVLDTIVKTFKLSPSSEKYLHGCTKPGEGVLAVSSPFHQEYQIKLELTDKEKEIIFNENHEPHCGYVFKSCGLEALAREQHVIMADWIDGDATALKGYSVQLIQNALAKGNTTAYIEEGLIKDGMIWNQHPDHYLTVCQIAGYGIQKGCEATVNHNSDADVVLKLPNGKLFPIEYQTSDNHIHEKRLNHITKYGSVVFVGNTASCADMRAAFNGSDEQREIAQQIIISRGKQLANKLDEVIEENNHKTPNLCG